MLGNYSYQGGFTNDLVSCMHCVVGCVGVSEKLPSCLVCVLPSLPCSQMAQVGTCLSWVASSQVTMCLRRGRGRGRGRGRRRSKLFLCRGGGEPGLAPTNYCTLLGLACTKWSFTINIMSKVSMCLIQLC